MLGHGGKVVVVLMVMVVVLVVVVVDLVVVKDSVKGTIKISTSFVEFHLNLIDSLPLKSVGSGEGSSMVERG